jgi:hypothetical protein
MAGPYGLGPYGVGPYSVGNVVDLRAATAISFSLSVKLAVTLALAGTTSITFHPVARMQRIVQPFGGATRIVFSVQGEFADSWAALDACETGTWTQEFPPWTERAAA